MPILQYLFGVGGALLCLMFVLDAYVPKAPPREQRDVDKSTIHVAATRTGDFVIDHFPVVRGDLADAANDAVRKAMAMMPPEDTRQPIINVPQGASVAPPPARKRRLAQRPQPRLATGEMPSPAQPQPSSGNAWSSGSWSSNGWSGDNRSGNWNNSWSRGWNNNWSQNRDGNHWADSRWTR